MRRKNRNIKRVIAAVSLLAVCACAAGVLAWQQKNIAQRHLSQSLYAAALNKLAQEEYGDAAAYVAQAARLGNENARYLAQSMLAMKTRRQLLPNLAVERLQFSPDSRYLAGFIDKGEKHYALQLWDARQGRLIRESPPLPGNHVPKVFFDQHNRVYSQSGEQDILRYDMQAEDWQRLYSADAPLQLLGLSGDGRYLLLRQTFDGVQEGVIYDSEQGRLLDYSRLAGQGLPMAAFDRGASRALLWFAGQDDSRALYLDFAAASARPLHIAAAFQQAEFSPYSPHLLLKDGKGYAVFDLASQRLSLLPESPLLLWAGFNDDARSVLGLSTRSLNLFSLQGVLLEEQALEAGSEFTQAFFPNPRQSPDHLQQRISLNNQSYVAHSAGNSLLISDRRLPLDILQIVPSPDGAELFVLEAGGKSISRLALEDSQARRQWRAFETEISYFDILARDSGRDVLMAVSAEKVVAFYTLDDAAPIGRPVATQARQIRLNQDNTQFLTRSDAYSFAIWDIDSGQELRRYRRPQGLDNFTTDAHFRYVLIAAEAGWELDDIEGNLLLAEEQTLSNAVFSADNRWLAVAASDGNTDIYDLRSRRRHLRIATTADPVILFSPDSRILLISQDSRRLRLWDLDEGQAYGPAIALSSNPKLLRFSTDSRRLFVQNDGDRRILTVDIQLLLEGLSVQLWQVPGGQEAASAQSIDDLEAFYGRRYEAQTGAINDYQGQGSSASWYFQDIYTRSIAPDSPVRIIEAIGQLLPAHSSEQIQRLSSSYFYHPLAKAGLAEYFSRRPQTQALAQYLADLAARQIAAIGNPELARAAAAYLPEQP